jgi:hypothetical protein
MTSPPEGLLKVLEESSGRRVESSLPPTLGQRGLQTLNALIPASSAGALGIYNANNDELAGFLISYFALVGPIAWGLATTGFTALRNFRDAKTILHPDDQVGVYIKLRASGQKTTVYGPTTVSERWEEINTDGYVRRKMVKSLIYTGAIETFFYGLPFLF